MHGHRGARGLRPENTIPGFAHALTIGVDVLELDVGLTADGVVVLNHDQQLSAVNIRDTAPAWPGDPMFPYVGRPIGELTLAQIQTVDAGVRRPDDQDPFLLTQLPITGTGVPTLAEVCVLLERLESAAPCLAVEIKTDPDWPDAAVERFVRVVAETVDAYGLLRRTRLLGFDWRVLDLARRIAPEAGRVALIEHKTLGPGSRWLAGAGVRGTPGTGSALWVHIIASAITLGATVLSPERGLADSELIGEAHRAGLPVAVWTVNDPAEMARLVKLGVDAIVSDYPDRVRAVLAAGGLPMPAGRCGAGLAPASVSAAVRLEPSVAAEAAVEQQA